MSLKEEKISERLFSFLLIRFFLLFALFAAFYLFPIVLGVVKRSDVITDIFFIFFLSFLVFNLFSVFYYKKINKVRITRFAFLQFIVDVFFWVIISYLTGGLKSPYLYVIVINILYSGIILGEKGALTNAVISFFSLIGLGVVLKLEIFPDLSFLLFESSNIEWRDFLLRTSLFLLFFAVSGIISGKIAENFSDYNQEIEDQKIIESKIKRNFLNILSVIPEGVMLVDENSTLYLNKYAQNYKRYVTGLRYIVINRENFDDWIEIRVKDKIFSCSKKNYYNGQLIVLFSDITDKKSAEEDSKRIEKLAAIGNLTALIAHEIKNPLASLIGSTELLFAGYEAVDEDTERLVEIVRREGERIKRLLEDLFSYSQDRSFTYKETDIFELVSEIVKVAKAGYPLAQISAIGEHFGIDVDRDRIKETLWNLLLNALEATDKEGVIVFSVIDCGEKAEIRIKDNGPGISSDVQDKIFEPLFSTKERGSGFGLSIAHRNILKHGGSINFTTSEDGTEFVIELPFKREE